MLMGLSDRLAIARTPEEKDQIRERFLFLRQKTRDNDIDFSDIPEVTDFTGWTRAKPFLDKIREHNRRVNAELERKKLEENQS